MVSIAWQIEPQVGVGPVKFGTASSNYQHLLGCESKRFRHSPDSNEIIVYNALHLEIDDNGKIVGINIFRPRQVYMAGVQLLDRPMVEVVEELEAAGICFKECDAGYYHEQFHVVLVDVRGSVDGVEVQQ